MIFAGAAIGILLIAFGLAKEDAHRLKKQVTALEAALDACRVAEKANVKRAKDKEERYAEIATDADINFANLRGSYHAAVGRLQSTIPTSADGSGSASASGIHAEQTGDTFISITRDDALICADNTAFAQQAYDWIEAVSTDNQLSSLTDVPIIVDVAKAEVGSVVAN